ncbi:MAG: flippase-like domain-containing protein [Chloroflexi bacterium]|nr:flippase-like domain-containing protein [Chloroflexota bacterium]
MAHLRSKLLISLALGMAVVLALGLYADLPKLLGVLAGFRWSYLPAILGLTLLNYVLRFVKWQFFLGRIGVRALPLRTSALIFFSGFSMVMTPGKVGEWLKSYLLRQTIGTPLSVSAPVIIAERLSDGLAMAVLAMGGLLIYDLGWQTPALLLALLVAGLALVQEERIARPLLATLERLPFVGERIRHVEAFYGSARRLFSWRSLGLAVPLGIISWGGEGVAFFLVLRGLGIGGDHVNLIIEANFILGISSIFGAFSMLPGGLAIAEGSITGLLLLLGVVGDPTVAAAATLLIRFATLWFGVALGIVVLVFAARRLMPTTGAMASAPSPGD